ncbi:MAG: right-handed parallel beta-helix repeat-containing protein [Pirellula sp.]
MDSTRFECTNFLIEDCIAIGASDAGIYVGQSQDIVVRNCRAERNVAGIEIENSHRRRLREQSNEQNRRYFGI